MKDVCYRFKTHLNIVSFVKRCLHAGAFNKALKLFAGADFRPRFRQIKNLHLIGKFA